MAGAHVKGGATTRTPTPIPTPTLTLTPTPTTIPTPTLARTPTNNFTRATVPTEVVAHWRLVHDVGDYAVELGAEFIVLCDVGVATSREDSDKSTLAVARTRHVVERPVVSLVPDPTVASGGNVSE